MSEAWAPRALRWSYCAFIAWASAQVFIAGAGQHEPHAAVLASVELTAVAAFVFPPLEAAAGAVLAAVYVVASVVTVMQGEAPLRFVYYAATAIYIVVGQRRICGSASVRPMVFEEEEQGDDGEEGGDEAQRPAEDQLDDFMRQRGPPALDRRLGPRGIHGEGLAAELRKLGVKGGASRGARRRHVLQRVGRRHQQLAFGLDRWMGKWRMDHQERPKSS
jgi:hypothetical protein